MVATEPRVSSGSAPQAEPAQPVKPASSLQTSQADQEKATMALLGSANNPKGVLDLVKELTKQAPRKDPPPTPEDGTFPVEPETPAAPEAAPATPDAGTPPEGEPAAPAEGAEPAEPAAQAEPDPEPEPSGEVTPVKADRARIRLNEKDEVGRLAAAYQIRNRDWTLEQCLAAAKEKLGVSPANPAATAPEAPAPVGDPKLPRTISEVDSTIEKLEADKVQAAKDIDMAKVSEIDVQLRRLDRQRTALERAEERGATQQAAAYDRQFADSEARAAEFYPFVSDKDSPLRQRMIEIEESLEALSDPLFHDPNKPLLIAQMVAKENSIAPKKASAARVAAPAQPAAPRPPPKGVLPSGSSRSAAAPQVNPVDAAISSIKTQGDVQKLMKSLGVRQF